MSLVTCPDCQKQVSDKATSCPNCGCPITEIRDQLVEVESRKVKEIKDTEDNVHKLRDDKRLKRPKFYSIVCMITAIMLMTGIILLLSNYNENALSIFLGIVLLVFLLFLWVDWQKWAYWGLVILCCVDFTIRILSGLGFFPAILAFLWIGLLSWALQMKTHGIKLWNLLK